MDNMKKTYKQTCIEHIIDLLPNYEDQDVEICDLGMTLTESENANGSWYCSTYDAEQDLKAWFNDVGEFIDEYENDFGERPRFDAFADAESFHCLMMIRGVEKIFNQLDIVQDKWNKKITLDKKMIDQMIEELEAL